MTLPPGLQELHPGTSPSPHAFELAELALKGSLSVDRTTEMVAEHFASLPRVDNVVAVLTTFAPEDASQWISLGGRAWIREWRLPDSPSRAVPEGEAAAEAALTMPWMSQFTRTQVVAIPDSEALPPEAEQDRKELAACGVRAVIASTQLADAVVFGSISVGSATPGAWPDQCIADLRLLNAALTTRMQVEQAKRSMAEAIAVAEQAHASTQHFFATIGHELRTPVSAVIGYAEMMAEEGELALDEHGEFAEMIARDSGVVLRAGEQLLAIIEDLLSTGRTLGSEEARTDIDLAAAVDDVIHWHRTPARARQTKLVSLVEPGTTVHARASGLRQVLTNLIGNAIIHNGSGGTVEISAEQSLADARHPRVRVMVRDDGAGLTTDQLAQVFEPFVRFAPASVKGTGLGLPMARAVAERDGGVLGGESAPGEGSVFWVDLPASAAD